MQKATSSANSAIRNNDGEMHNETRNIEKFSRACLTRPDEIVKLNFTSFKARSGVIMASIRVRSYFPTITRLQRCSHFFSSSLSFHHFPSKLNSIIIRCLREEFSRISFPCAKNGTVE